MRVSTVALVKGEISPIECGSVMSWYIRKGKFLLSVVLLDASFHSSIGKSGNFSHTDWFCDVMYCDVRLNLKGEISPLVYNAT